MVKCAFDMLTPERLPTFLIINFDNMLSVILFVMRIYPLAYGLEINFFVFSALAIGEYKIDIKIKILNMFEIFLIFIFCI